MRKIALLRRWPAVIVLIAAAFFRVSSAAADDGADSTQPILSVGHTDDADADIDDALEAVREGRALPLSRLESAVTSRFEGDVIAVKVEHKQGKLLYEFKVLRPEGRVTEVEVNAATGKIEKVENN